MSVSGTVAPGFESVRDAFATGQSLDAGGAQLAVYRHGVKVVDLWTGQDPARGLPFDGNGFAVLMSVTKGLTATVAHLLAQRGQLDYDALVSQYWPEFVQNGKEKITVKMVLSHSAGLSAFPPQAKIRPADLADWQKIIRYLEEMPPFWPPGSQFLYAPWTYGYLVGEIVHRITGKTVSSIFQEEVAEPLGLNLWIGRLPEDKELRVIPGMLKTGASLPPIRSDDAPTASAPAKGRKFDLSDPLVASYIANFGRPETTVFLNTREGHTCELPAANGIGDARSLAKFYAHLIGEVDGKPPLLAPETLQRATAPQTDGLPIATPLQAMFPPNTSRFALGYIRPNLVDVMLGKSSFGHVGSGGRLAFADVDSGITVGYICNNPTWDPSGPDGRWLPWLKALREIA